MSGIGAPGTDQLRGEVGRILDRLRQLRDQLNTANNPAELDDITNRMKLVSRGMGPAGDEWVTDSLPRHFREQFTMAGGTGKIPKRYVDASYRNRTKARQSYAKMERRTAAWVDSQKRYVALEKSVQGLKAKLPQLRGTGTTQHLADIAKQRNAVLDKIDELRVQQARLPSSEPMVAYYHRSGKGKGKITGYAKASKFQKMVADYHSNFNANLAVIAAAETNGSGYVIVRDGSDCGLASHKAPDKVNGQVWACEKAFKYPLAHPQCERTFLVSEGPPGGTKTRAQLKRLFGVATKTATAAKGVNTIKNEILSNPFVNRYFRELLNDEAFNPPPFLTNYLTKISGYQNSMGKAFEMHGKRLGIESIDDMRKHVTGSLDEMFGTEEFIQATLTTPVSLSAEQATALKLPQEVSKGQLVSRMDDYGDWLADSRAMTADLPDRITHLRVVSGAQDEIRSIAALRFDMSAPEGLNARRNWYRAIKDLRKTFDADPDRATIDLIRLSARTFDPSPWLRATQGKFKLSVGMPADGRADLAEKLFKRLSKSTRWSETEMRWAQELGLDLKNIGNTDFTRQDLLQALTPRISYDSGNLFSSTVGLVNGKLQPIMRIYPPRMLGRALDLETKLRSGAVEDFIKAFKASDAATKQGALREALRGLDEDVITTLRLWRNGPIGATARLTGTSVERVGFYIKPQSGWMRYSYNFYSDEAMIKQLSLKSVDEIRSLADSIGIAYTQEQTRAEIVRKIVRQAGPFQINSWREGLVVMPRLGGVFQSIGMSEADVIGRMIRYKGNVLEAARSLRMDYGDVAEWWKRTGLKYQELWTEIGDEELFNARSWDDIKRILTVPDRVPSKLVQADLTDDVRHVTDGVSDYIAKKPELMTDIARAKRLFREEFPNMRMPDFDVVDIGPPLELKDGVVLIRRDLADDWATAASMRSKAVKVGHFPADTGDSAGSIIHEMIHGQLENWTSAQRRRIMSVVMEDLTWAKVPNMNIEALSKSEFVFQNRWFNRPEIKKQVERRLGKYATTNVDEFISEALVEYLTSPNPRPLSVAVGEQFRRMV